MTFWQQITHWGEDLEAFIGSFAKTEVAQLTPIAETAITNLTTEEATALATGKASDTGHILAKVVAEASNQAAIAGITAAPASLAGAVGAAVAKHQANASKGS